MFLNNKIILALISGASITIGLFVFLKPELTIEIQRRFYEKLNWRIEPINVPKEIRNTKIMGMFLVVVAIATVVVYFLIK
ncbi:MAG: hypothetical protein NTY14_06490 [Candidatus Omnitrophica bacterium]|nr:hypothetical protein [Candidatus Omnitrophota bacterium]